MNDEPIQPSEPAEPAQPAATEPTQPSTSEPAEPAELAVKGRRARRIVALAVAVVLVAGASATASYLWVLRGSDEALVTKVPADVDMFMTAYLDPSAAQKRNLERIVGEFPALGSGDALSENVDEALDDALTSFGLGSGDVRPWLGSQVGFAMDFPSSFLVPAEPTAALLVDVSDEAGAGAALEKMRQVGSWSAMEHGGVTVWAGEDSSGSPTFVALVDGTLVLATEQGIVEGIIDTAQGKAPDLASSQAFARTEELLPEERLALFYLNFDSIMELISASGGFAAPPTPADTASLESLEGMGMTLSAQPQGIALDMAMAMDPSKLGDEERASLTEPERINSLLSWVPQDVYLVETSAGIDELVQPFIDQLSQDPQAALGLERFGLTGPDGLIEHLTGELVLEAGPGPVPPYPSGAVLIGTDDASSMERTFGLLEKPVAKSFEQPRVWIDDDGELHVKVARRPEWQTSEHDGVTVHFLPVKETAKTGVAVSYAVTDEVGIVASSPEEVERLLDTHAGGTSITQDPSFQNAMEQVGGPEGSIFYADLTGIVDAIRNALPPDERSFFDLSVGPNLDPLVALAVGGASDARSATARVFLVIG